jgi:dihydroxy-acid dehydratase
VVVFDGSDDYHHRINDPLLAIDERTMLVIRGAGPVGWPGSAEVVNMQPPDALIKKGITALPTLGDGRQSGTSDSPSILNASPESAAGGNLALLRTGDVVRVDLNTGSCNVLISDDELDARRKDAQPAIPPNQTPWQQIYRATVGQLHTGACMEMALPYRGVGHDMPRHNH